MRRLVGAFACLFVLLLGTGLYHRFKPLPPGLSFSGPWQPATDVRFLRDLTYLDADGQRRTEQEIFDAVLRMIDEAEQFILVDMFLFNDFQGAKPELTRALCRELTDRLIARKEAVPGMEVHVLTDPINTVYGGLRSSHLDRLRAAGVEVTITDLARLRDSNALYSSIWRWIGKPFGNDVGNRLPNPFGEGRVSLRSYFALLNFKANHRKVVIADGPRGVTGLVTSANPHDGSSAHGNVALQFDGAAALDLLAAEKAVLAFSGGPEVRYRPAAAGPAEPSALEVRIVTENAIEAEALRQITQGGAEIRLVMFYLSDRRIITALKAAAEGGARLRIILDPNKDAFGHEKGGIPNRQVAAELLETPGIEIRWADTHGEQCHSKLLLTSDSAGKAAMLLGSANYTRRNLDDFNLELNAAVTGPLEGAAFQWAGRYFEELWNNSGDRTFTTEYGTYRDDSRLKYWRYRVMEASGLSTF